MGCIEYLYNSLEDKVDKSACATSYQVGWIDYISLVRNSGNIKYETQKTLQSKSESKIHRPRQTHRPTES